MFYKSKNNPQNYFKIITARLSEFRIWYASLPGQTANQQHLELVYTAHFIVVAKRERHLKGRALSIVIIISTFNEDKSFLKYVCRMWFKTVKLLRSLDLVFSEFCDAWVRISTEVHKLSWNSLFIIS